MKAKTSPRAKKIVRQQNVPHDHDDDVFRGKHTQDDRAKVLVKSDSFYFSNENSTDDMTEKHRMGWQGP